ncbi:MAG: Ig-like domain-containing protein [Candidatus Roizmanbacteria bacterium]|nr:Ig-like domain-containing protein [Candidatus Roizmanbacteria bacterium]
MIRRKKVHPWMKLALIVSAIIAAGYIFIFFIFGFLINLAFSVRDGVGNTAATTVQKEGPLVLLDPTLDDVPYATNTATITVHGTAMAETTVDLLVNGGKRDSRRSSFEGEFSFDVVLTEGENILRVASEDSDGKQTLKSRDYAVLYLDTPPELTVDGLEDGKTVDKPDFTVQGKTDKEVFIQINNAPVVVRADGSFSTSITLKEGDNTITVVATDVAGNETKQEAKIVYKK